MGEKLTPVSLGAESWYLVHVSGGCSADGMRYSRLLN